MGKKKPLTCKQALALIDGMEEAERKQLNHALYPEMCAYYEAQIHFWCRRSQRMAARVPRNPVKSRRREAVKLLWKEGLSAGQIHLALAADARYGTMQNGQPLTPGAVKNDLSKLRRRRQIDPRRS